MSEQPSIEQFKTPEVTDLNETIRILKKIHFELKDDSQTARDKVWHAIESLESKLKNELERDKPQESATSPEGSLEAIVKKVQQDIQDLTIELENPGLFGKSGQAHPSTIEFAHQIRRDMYKVAGGVKELQKKS